MNNDTRYRIIWQLIVLRRTIKAIFITAKFLLTFHKCNSEKFISIRIFLYRIVLPFFWCNCLCSTILISYINRSKIVLCPRINLQIIGFKPIRRQCQLHIYRHCCIIRLCFQIAVFLRLLPYIITSCWVLRVVGTSIQILTKIQHIGTNRFIADIQLTVITEIRCIIIRRMKNTHMLA